jgi:hypothetical protein
MAGMENGGRQPDPGDRVLLWGTVESVHDGFVMVRVDGTAPHAVPQRYDLVAVRPAALEPGPHWRACAIGTGGGGGNDTPTVGGGGSGKLRIQWRVNEGGAAGGRYPEDPREK